MSARPVPLRLALAGAVLVGALTAVQARLNGSLGTAIGDGWIAGLISFASGLVVVAFIAPFVPATRAALRRLAELARARDLAPWLLAGGAAGAFTVVAQGVTIGTTGVALFTVGVVAGQTLGGLVLDRVGYGPAGVVAVTIPRVVGAALALGGAALCAAGAATGVWALLVLPVLAGAGISWQQATNGRLRGRIGDPLAATLVNFAGGTLVLAIVGAAHIAVAGAPATLRADPWLYLGGAVGVAYIALSAAIVRVTGVLLLGLGSVVGLLATSIVLDAIRPTPSAPVLPIAVAAAAIALAGVAVVVVPWRRR
ncbi:DMT family transporter [Microbacterium sp. 10M-3C3]|jgi:transporter family-2 protein|uniref:DMT family transporter n=1 Tax=Microbacterium sp. 10M-3C3 TaxID=2483401 RepID=UPI000F63BD62|nr:DMT family transporter [Microbacterium sp. 10M-3C3]